VGIDFIDQPTPVALSANGSIAYLQNFGASATDVYLYDTIAKVLTHVTTTGTASYQEAIYGISGDGNHITGTHDAPVQAAIWSDAGGWVNLGSPFDAGCDPNVGGGFGLNFDGTVAVGLLWEGCHTDAFRWTDSSGMGAFTLLDKLGSATIDGGSDRASVVSADGQVMAGFVQTGTIDRTPALWTVDGGGIMLDPVQAGPGEVLAISADGQMVAGVVNQDGFFWTADAGLVDIGKLAISLPTDTAYLNAIAAGGQLIFGGCGDPFNGGVLAVVWTADGGMQTLQDIAVAQGVVIPSGYVLSDIVSASTDGTTLLGFGMDMLMNTTSFVLRLPVSAYGIDAGM